ncbi:uncharacterized protein METZ01_LOCUS366917 [marine metagenome]|uniref:Uncharacterized protein n=1 Tax=marine metagenome TaxID=408172 RepID=A0A382SWC5_9ZZZZ
MTTVTGTPIPTSIIGAVGKGREKTNGGF